MPLGRALGAGSWPVGRVWSMLPRIPGFAFRVMGKLRIRVAVASFRTLRITAAAGLLGLAVTPLACIGGSEFVTSLDGGASGSDAGNQDSGRGSACESRDDCSEDAPHCQPLSLTCVECLSHDQCAPDQRCRDERCEAACSNDGACSSLDRRYCDGVSALCVQCRTTADCNVDEECASGTCQAFEPCVNSRDCDATQVCDAGAGKCVDCVRDTDCASGEACLNARCRTRCGADPECAAAGLVCNASLGVCAECNGHSDCPEQAHCKDGTCALDVCTAGSSRCDGNAIAACDAGGTSLLPAVPCGARQSCADEATTASCRDWFCNPGSVECVSERVLVECSEDGLTALDTTDCEETDQYCFSGSCQDQPCSGGALFCQANEIRFAARQE